MHNFSNSTVGPSPSVMLIYRFDCSEENGVDIHTVLCFGCVKNWCNNRASDQFRHQIIKEILVDGLHLAFKPGKLAEWILRHMEGGTACPRLSS